jgi:hypothetical protein
MFTLNNHITLKNPDSTQIQQIKTKLLNQELLSDLEITSLLNYIVFLTYNQLKQSSNIDLTTSPMTNTCNIVSDIAGNYLEQMGIDTRYLETQQVISSSVTGHSFLVAAIQENATYLIDLSYRQFFIKDNCTLSKYKKIGDLVIDSPDPGYYYEVNPQDKIIAEKLLEQGYIKLDEYSAKVYCDSFNTTKRGYKDTTFKSTNITGSIYLSSLLKKGNSHKR